MKATPICVLNLAAWSGIDDWTVTRAEFIVNLRGNTGTSLTSSVQISSNDFRCPNNFFVDFFVICRTTRVLQSPLPNNVEIHPVMVEVKPVLFVQNA